MKIISFSIGILLIVLSFKTQGQTLSRWVIGSTGSSNEMLSYTVGETIISTGSIPNFILTQGFQQPDNITIVSIDPQIGDWTVNIYPNPTSSELVLELEMENPVEIKVQFTDILGRQVLPLSSINPAISNHENFQVNSLAAGMYLIILRSVDGRLIKSLKFEKMD